MNTFTGNNFDLGQLVKTLELKKAKEMGDADDVRLKITKDDETIFEGALSELLLEKLLEHYGNAEIWNFALTFENYFVEMGITVELR